MFRSVARACAFFFERGRVYSVNSSAFSASKKFVFTRSLLSLTLIYTLISISPRRRFCGENFKFARFFGSLAVEDTSFLGD